MFSPLPSAGQDGVSALVLSSPILRMCGSYSYIRPVGCHTLCPNTDGSLGAGRSRVSSNNFASCTLAPDTTTLKGPPSASTRMLRLVPALPLQILPRIPPIRLPIAPSADCHSQFTPPNSVTGMTAQTLGNSRPTSGRCVDCAVITKVCSQPELDRVEHTPRILALATRLLWRIHLFDDWLYLLP